MIFVVTIFQRVIVGLMTEIFQGKIDMKFPNKNRFSSFEMEEWTFCILEKIGYSTETWPRSKFRNIVNDSWYIQNWKLNMTSTEKSDILTFMSFCLPPFLPIPYIRSQPTWKIFGTESLKAITFTSVCRSILLTISVVCQILLHVRGYFWNILDGHSTANKM